MGQNLARNVASHGFPIAVHNRTTAKTDRFIADHGREGEFTAAATVEAFVGALSRPRAVMIMVQAGAPVDAVIDELAPVPRTGRPRHRRRQLRLDRHRPPARRARRARHPVPRQRRVGRRGGRAARSEPHARRHARRLRPHRAGLHAHRRAGRRHAVLHLHRRRRSRALREDGAQRHRVRRHAAHRRVVRPAALRARARQRRAPRRLHRVEHRRARLVPHPDHRRGVRARATTRPTASSIDAVLDSAGQKGTGRHTAQSALELGAPVTAITEAVFARSLSALKADRVAASTVLRSRATRVRRNSPSTTSATRCTRRRSSRTRRASISCSARPPSSDGHSTSARSPRSGAVDASSAPASSTASARSTPATHRRTSCSPRRSRTRSAARATRLAAHRRRSDPHRHPDARVLVRARVVRRLPPRATPREPHPGAARLVRRPHLPTRRPRRHVPLRLVHARLTVQSRTG